MNRLATSSGARDIDVHHVVGLGSSHPSVRKQPNVERQCTVTGTQVRPKGCALTMAPWNSTKAKVLIVLSNVCSFDPSSLGSATVRELTVL